MEILANQTVPLAIGTAGLALLTFIVAVVTSAGVSPVCDAAKNAFPDPKPNSWVKKYLKKTVKYEKFFRCRDIQNSQTFRLYKTEGDFLQQNDNYFDTSNFYDALGAIQVNGSTFFLLILCTIL